VVLERTNVIGTRQSQAYRKPKQNARMVLANTKNWYEKRRKPKLKQIVKTVMQTIMFLKRENVGLETRLPTQSPVRLVQSGWLWEMCEV
jgi:hypothetical protein